MSTPNNNLPLAQVLVQAHAAVTTATGIAKEAAAKLAAAPKRVANEEIEKTASLLLEHGWIVKENKDRVKQALADPLTAIQALQKIAVESSRVGRSDPRLEAGQPIGPETSHRMSGDMSPPMQSKQAAEESDADRMYRERLESYSRNGRA